MARRPHHSQSRAPKPGKAPQRKPASIGRMGLELARKNLIVQVLAVLVAIPGVAVTLLSWHPWSSPVAPSAILKLVGAESYVVPGLRSQFPAPPYSLHCSDWNAWALRAGAAPVPSMQYIEVEAPAAADVTITAANIHVFRSYLPSHLSSIVCITGAGPSVATDMFVSLSMPSALPRIVSASGGTAPLAMPGSVVNISPGHTEYLDVQPAGEARYYNWSITFTVVVNQQAKEVTIGSASHPLASWLGEAQQ